MADPQEIMEVGFMIIYFIYILIIVIIMIKRKSSLPSERQPTALRILLGFLALLIGDFGHVSARLFIFFSINTDINNLIFGIGILLENIGLRLLFIFWLDAWRLEFSHSKNSIYYILIITGIIGLIIFIFPQNDWIGNSAPQYWKIIRNIPWVIQGMGISILIINDGNRKKDKLMKKIGICIIISFLFYMPVIFVGDKYPFLGMLMIPGTIAYMFWEFYSLKRFFSSN